MHEASAIINDVIFTSIGRLQRISLKGPLDIGLRMLCSSRRGPPTSLLRSLWFKSQSCKKILISSKNHLFFCFANRLMSWPNLIAPILESWECSSLFTLSISRNKQVVINMNKKSKVLVIFFKIYIDPMLYHSI